jgi:hypothetical protein
MEATSGSSEARPEAQTKRKPTWSATHDDVHLVQWRCRWSPLFEVEYVRRRKHVVKVASAGRELAAASFEEWGLTTRGLA